MAKAAVTQSRNGRGMTRQQQKEETRARILECAAALFAERGYFETRIADIAKAAGVSHGSLFAHFGSKEGVLRALHVADLERFAAVLATRELTAATPLERLIEAADLVWKLDHEHLDLRIAFMSATWVWDEEHEGIFTAMIEVIRHWLRPILLDLQAEGRLDPERDIDALFDVLQALYFDMLRRSRFSDAAADAAFRGLLRGTEAALGLPSRTITSLLPSAT